MHGSTSTVRLCEIECPAEAEWFDGADETSEKRRCLIAVELEGAFSAVGDAEGKCERGSLLRFGKRQHVTEAKDVRAR